MRNRILGLLTTIILGGAIMVGLTSCGDSDDNKGNNQKKVVVLLPDNSSLDRWATDKENLEKVLGTYGFQTDFYEAPETAEGADQQVNQLRNAINGGAKYIVLTAIDYQKINDSKLLEQNPDVKVVCHDRIIPDNPRIAYISSTNAKSYYDGAMELLKSYIDDGSLVVKSGKKEYSQVKSDSWSIADGRKAMQDRLASYAEGERPDMILAANDNLAQGAIATLMVAGITDMPVITGQDNTAVAEDNIKNGRQAMTIDKNLEDMAYNTALIVNSLVSKSPVQSSQSINGIPVFYSKPILMTIDSY